MNRDRPWDGIAVVTGASSGIGAALAAQLAQRGHDLLLALEPDEPDPADDLRQRHGIEVTTVVVDLADPGSTAEFCSRLRTQQVAVLCNNAGIGRFGRYPATSEPAQLRINVEAVTMLTNCVVPQMISRRQGGILFTGSIAGDRPIPGAAIYAATKAYVNSFAEALHAELRPHGVACTVVTPGFVATEFPCRAGQLDAARRIPSFVWAAADEIATAGLDGLARGRRRVVPGVRARALRLALAAPRAVQLPVTRALLSHYIT